MICLGWLIGATNKVDKGCKKRTEFPKGRRKMSFLTLHLCPEGGLDPIWKCQWEISQSKVKCHQTLEQLCVPCLYPLFTHCFVDSKLKKEKRSCS